MNQFLKKYFKIVGSPKIFVFTVIWMMVLVFIGTIVQKDIGLYAAQMQYFSSWFIWVLFVPLPSGKLTMLIMFVNLSCYFFIISPIEILPLFKISQRRPPLCKNSFTKFF